LPFVLGRVRGPALAARPDQSAQKNGNCELNCKNSENDERGFHDEVIGKTSKFLSPKYMTPIQKVADFSREFRAIGYGA